MQARCLRAGKTSTGKVGRAPAVPPDAKRSDRLTKRIVSASRESLRSRACRITADRALVELAEDEWPKSADDPVERLQ